jgi:integrase
MARRRAPRPRRTRGPRLPVRCASRRGRRESVREAPPLPPLAARSVQRYHQVPHAALHQAVRWQLLVRNPADAVEPPRPARREMRILTPAQARQLMAMADTTPLGSFVRLAILTGMRRGELLGLRWQDIDLERGSLHVQQTAQRIEGQGIVFRQPKTRLSRRAIALSPEAVAALRQHRKQQAEARLLTGPAYQDQGLVHPDAERRCAPEGRLGGARPCQPSISPSTRTLTCSLGSRKQDAVGRWQSVSRWP